MRRALLALPLLVAAAHAAASVQGTDGVRFGRAVCAIPDQEGDGVGDFVVTAPLAGEEPFHAGRVYVFSGKGPELLRGFAGPAERAEVGARVEWIEDRAALLLASEWKAGSFLLDLEGGLVHAFGPELAGVVAAGDWDCDGRVDFAAEREGEVLVLSGEDFAPLPTSPRSRPGRLLGTPGDLDGDGGAELVVLDGRRTPPVFLWSSRGDRGPRGLRLPERAQVERPWPPWAFAPLGDLDGDHVGELAIGRPWQDRVYLLSGDGGAPLFERGPRSDEAGLYGFALLRGSELGAGAPFDLVVGAPDGAFRPQGVYAVRLDEPAPRWRVQDPLGSGVETCIGASLCALDDLDGDGVRELLVGGADVWPPHGRVNRVGSVRILSGRTGRELWSLGVDELPDAGEAR